MALVLEIEHLLGVSFAAQSPASSAPDWPPQPDRVFSALVATWGARGERPAERRALEWLEALPQPELAASGGFERSAAIAFVPPNDSEAGRVGNKTILPALRSRQPRRFPAYRPDDPLVRLIWRNTEADDDTMTALNALAADTPYVGHSASLTRCRFRADGAPEKSMHPRRRVYKGRLAELETRFHAGLRPSEGADVHVVTDPGPPPAHGIFADRWLVLEQVAGNMPDIRAAALVAKALRNTVMSGYRRTVGESAVPAIVSGHAPDGAPLSEPHMAILPLAFLGRPHADGHVIGFALVPPGKGELLDDPTFQKALKAVAEWREKEARRELQVVDGDDIDVTLSMSGEMARYSLYPAPYVATARTWATCTPIVLDRHLKATGNVERELEMRELIAGACRGIGLPEPARMVIEMGGEKRETYAIRPDKHSAVEGAPSAYPSGRAPRWTGWRLSKSLASRHLTHAVLQFEQPVRGPVILGAGRFVGLGLCRALPERG